MLDEIAIESIINHIDTYEHVTRRSLVQVMDNYIQENLLSIIRWPDVVFISIIIVSMIIFIALSVLPKIHKKGYRRVQKLKED